MTFLVSASISSRREWVGISPQSSLTESCPFEILRRCNFSSCSSFLLTFHNMADPKSSKLARQRSCSSDTSFHTTRLRSSTGSLIVVANRLPVTITSDPSAEGGYRFSVSSGGLASALSGCKKSMDFIVSLSLSLSFLRSFAQLTMKSSLHLSRSYFAPYL